MGILNKENSKTLALLLPALLFLALSFGYVYYAIEQRAQSEAKSGSNNSEQLAEPFAFDPNTVTYWELLDLGFTKREAASILKYRARGKVFGIKEEFAACYAVSDSAYRRLEPYIIIGDEYGVEPLYAHQSERRTFRKYNTSDRFGSRHTQRKGGTQIALTPFMIDTAGVEFLSRVGFTPRQAEVVVKYRRIKGGFRSMEEFEECFVVDSAMAATLRPYIIFAKPKPTSPQLIEINGADTAALISVYGIGEKSAVEIIRYRKRLGGFHSTEQIAEVRGVTESNFERILPQICCDSFSISKIDVNFAPPKVMVGHPYLPPKTIRKILKARQLKGGWSTIEEMTKDNILTKDEAQRLRPYLRFGKQLR